MKLVLQSNVTLYNQFVLAQHPNQFLQSSDWAEFQRRLGRQTRQFLVIDEEVSPIDVPTIESIMAGLMVVTMPLTTGFTYYYIPRGPIVYLQIPVPDQNEMWRTVVAGLRKQFVKRDHALFLRMDPGIAREEPSDLRSILTSKYPVEYLKKSVQPQTTLLLDLTRSEDELLQQMHQKTRYNIRLAEKKGLTITTGWSAKEAADFWKLLQETAERDAFSPHPEHYYATMVEVLGGNWKTRDLCGVQFYRAEHEGKTLAMNLVLSYGDTVTYLHGASSSDGRNLMAPYLLQWQAIKDAKAHGAHYYDFWGIAPTYNPKHPWAGLTRFKKGFNGNVISYWGTQDIVYHSIPYILYRTFRRSR